MKYLILFSQPTTNVLSKISSYLFYKPNTKVAFMPSDGANPKNEKYINFWKEYIKKHNGTIIVIDNSLRGKRVKKEKEKLKQADSLILSGGNTFVFLNHLKESGLFETIKTFASKDKVIAGFSAGAILMSPTIEIVTIPEDDADENIVNIKDLTSFGFINFDIYPHYEKSKKSIVDKYEQEANKEVRRLTDEDFLIL